MRPGSRPKPTAMKRRAGNPGKRPLNESEPEPKPGEPERPQWLSEVGQTVWDAEAAELASIGVLTQADGIAFGLLCEAMANYIEDVQAVRDDGKVATSEKGSVYQHPRVGMRNKSWEQVMRACREFGLTPSSRSQVTATKPQQRPEGKGRFFKVVGA